jgi:hypothetical protein
LTTNLPGLPEGMVTNGYSAGLQNGLNIVSLYSNQDKTKSMMVNTFASAVPIENPIMDPVLPLRAEDVVNDAPSIGDSSKLYIQNNVFQLVFIQGKIRAMLIGNGLKQPEVIKIARRFASVLPKNTQIPASFPSSGKELDSVLYDRYFKSSSLFISDQNAAPVKASTCPDNAYITFNFDLNEPLPEWKLQLLDGKKNVIYEMIQYSAEKKNTSLVIPAIINSAEYEVLFHVNGTLVFDDLIRCGI